MRSWICLLTILGVTWATVLAASAHGQAPVPTPQSPTYTPFGLDPASQLTINYTLKDFVGTRCPLDRARASAKSQILINYMPTGPDVPKPAKVTIALTYGKNVQFTHDIAGVAWNAAKNQYGLTADQVADLADAFAKSATKNLRNLDDEHPIPVPGRATLQITPDGGRQFPVDSSIQITFQPLAKIDPKPVALKAVQDAQALDVKAKEQGKKAKEQDAIAQRQAKRAKELAAQALLKGDTGAKDLAVAMDQLKTAELQTLVAQQQVDQAQKQVIQTQQQIAQASASTDPTDAQLATIKAQQDAIKAQQDATDKLQADTTKLQAATDAAQK